MTTETRDDAITTALDEIVAAAGALVRAGRWDTADRLLAATSAATGAGDPPGRAALAVAAAEVAVDRDMFTGSRRAPEALAAADGPVTAAGDPVLRWDLARLRLFADYQAELFAPDERDPARLAELAAQADRLTVDAPDAGRRGWASFHAALVVDNLVGDPAAGKARYATALRLAEQVDDGLLASYALRHLGSYHEVAGDLAAARERWERATDLRAAAGHVTGVLAQQVLLATLADREGDRAGARAVATEVRRWATALGLPWLGRQADGVLAG
jgi:hypothetical protein